MDPHPADNNLWADILVNGKCIGQHIAIFFNGGLAYIKKSVSCGKSETSSFFFLACFVFLVTLGQEIVIQDISRYSKGSKQGVCSDSTPFDRT